MSEPLTWNGYGWVDGNTPNLIDPVGLYGQSAIFSPYSTNTPIIAQGCTPFSDLYSDISGGGESCAGTFSFGFSSAGGVRGGRGSGGIYSPGALGWNNIYRTLDNSVFGGWEPKGEVNTAGFGGSLAITSAKIMPLLGSAINVTLPLVASQTFLSHTTMVVVNTIHKSISTAFTVGAGLEFAKQVLIDNEVDYTDVIISGIATSLIGTGIGMIGMGARNMIIREGGEGLFKVTMQSFAVLRQANTAMFGHSTAELLKGNSLGDNETKLSHASSFIGEFLPKIPVIIISYELLSYVMIRHLTQKSCER